MQRHGGGVIPSAVSAQSLRLLRDGLERLGLSLPLSARKILGDQRTGLPRLGTLLKYRWGNKDWITRSANSYALMLVALISDGPFVNAFAKCSRTRLEFEAMVVALLPLTQATQESSCFEAKSIHSGCRNTPESELHSKETRPPAQ